MLTILPLYSLATALILSSSSPSTDLRSRSVRTVADTGADMPSLLLTQPVTTSYSAVVKALTAYWAGHEEQFRTSQQHGVNIPLSVGTMEAGMTVPDYPTLVQQDTALAAIFTRCHFVPMQFVPIMHTVREAIGAVLQHQAIDSTTVMGKNMMFVQANRPGLAADWSEEQRLISQYGSADQMLQSKFQQIKDSYKAKQSTP